MRFRSPIEPCEATRRLSRTICRSKEERQKEFRLTSVDPEYVRYYDIATGTLDIRPIGQVYGVPNFYQDVRNTENINELEMKLARLEHQASSIIQDMHRALPHGTFTLKRRDLELLRKFLFIMHYRNVSCSSHYFQADHPENANARQWIECFMKAKCIQSPVETWLHVLRYYLDTSHSDIMRDAAELAEKYGEAGLAMMLIKTHIPPDFNYPAFTYQGHADYYFLSVWEAAEGEEFILTRNGFGLWEGLACGHPDLHRIFVVSPRIAIVLRNVILRPEIRSKGILESGLRSSLLSVDAVPATPVYADGGDSLRANSKSAKSLARYRSSQEGANDSFMFKITKLSRPQTLELNSVVLLNVEEAGSLTFLSRENMLRTARAFRSSPTNFPRSKLVVPLIDHLTATTETGFPAYRLPLQSLAAVPDGDIDALSLVDVVLYVLLMQICTGRKRFPSAYDRAHLVLKIMEKAKFTSFAHEISQEVEKAFHTCKGESEDAASPLEGVGFAPLLSSIPNKLSCQLFHLMIPYMRKLGAAVSGGEGILEDLQNEVTVVSFLTRASCSPGVWHTLSCSSTAAPEILSKLFNQGTEADGLVASFAGFHYKKSSPPVFASCYEQAYAMRGMCGMSGPTTNFISLKYYEYTAVMMKGFGSAMQGSLPEPYSSRPCKRPKARLVRKMSKMHSDLLMSNMIMILQPTGFTPSPGGDTVAQIVGKWIDEMAIVAALAWLGRHRRNFLDFLLDRAPREMPVDFKLFEDEEDTACT